MTWSEPRYGVYVAAPGVFLAATQGVVNPPSDPVVLLDDFTFAWEAVEGRIPGEFEPQSLSIGFGALKSSDLDWLKTGTLLDVLVYLVAEAPGWAMYRTFRVTDVDLTLDPKKRRKVVARVSAVDRTADLRSRFPNPSGGNYPVPPGSPWIRSISEIAYHAGIKLYAPADITWSIDYTMPSLAAWPEVSADETLARILNTVTASSSKWGNDRHLAVMPLDTGLFNDLGPPTDYQNLTEAGVMFNGQWHNYESPADAPAFVLVPLDRKVAGPVGLPYEPSGNGIVLADDADVPQSGLAVVNGCLVEAPASARRSRGNAFTVAVLEGSTFEPDDGGVFVWGEGTTEVTGPGARLHGPITRTIPVFTAVRSLEVSETSVNGRQAVRQNVAEIAQTFLSTSTELGIATQFDAFDIRVSSLDDAALAHRMIRALTPASPIATAAGQYDSTTAVFVHGVDSELVPEGTIKGFATAGALNITKGRLTYTVTIAPGDPEILTTTDQHRYTDSLGAYTYATVDQGLTYSDLALTRRTP